MSNLSDASDSPFVIDGVDMRVLARRQRWILWLVFALLWCEIAPLFTVVARSLPGGIGVYVQIGMVVSFAVRILVVVYGLLFMGALRTNVFVMMLCAPLLFLPLLNLLILLLENRNAMKRLRKAGLTVGFMGVRDEQVIVKLAPNLCRQCGYNLTGNTSGICPECGAASVPAAACAEYKARPLTKC